MKVHKSYWRLAAWNWNNARKVLNIEHFSGQIIINFSVDLLQISSCLRQLNFVLNDLCTKFLNKKKVKHLFVEAKQKIFSCMSSHAFSCWSYACMFCHNHHIYIETLLLDYHSNLSNGKRRQNYNAYLFSNRCSQNYSKQNPYFYTKLLN